MLDNFDINATRHARAAVGGVDRRGGGNRRDLSSCKGRYRPGAGRRRPGRGHCAHVNRQSPSLTPDPPRQSSRRTAHLNPRGDAGELQWRTGQRQRVQRSVGGLVLGGMSAALTRLRRAAQRAPTKRKPGQSAIGCADRPAEDRIRLRSHLRPRADDAAWRRSGRRAAHGADRWRRVRGALGSRERFCVAGRTGSSCARTARRC